MKSIVSVVLAIFLLSFAYSVAVSQRRNVQTPVAAQTSDALVFVNSGWIYYLAPNSSVPRKLVKGSDPALSPDRQRVAYYAPIHIMRDAGDAPDSGRLMLLDLASGKSASLFFPSAGRIGHPQWSPSGERIAFALSIYGGVPKQLHMIASDGTQEQNFAGEDDDLNGGFDLNSSWLPDGQSLYFLGTRNLVQVSRAGKILTRTPQADISGEKDISVEWVMPCPTNSNILVFVKVIEDNINDEPGNTALFIYDRGARARRRLTPRGVFARNPVWSRDGRFIYFSGFRGEAGTYKIYRIARDGTGLIQITSGEDPNT